MSRTLDARRRGGATRFLISRHCVLLVSLLVAAPVLTASTQLPPAPLPLSGTEDARTLAKGTVRFRAMTAWTGFDNLYAGPGDTTSGARPLGDLFSTPHLGADHIASLAQAQAAARALTGNATLRLDAGQLVTTANARIVTTPLALEYGVTNHLTLGVMVPVVQTLTTVVVELNPRRLSSADVNVGPNPALFSGNTARSTNLGVYDALSRAHDDLTAALAACSTNPSGPVCSQPDLARQAQSLSDSYRTAIQSLYGTDDAHPGSAFVPTAALQAVVSQQLATLDASLETLLGQRYLPTTGLVGAGASAALLQLQQLLTDPAGVAFDSLGSPTRIGVGDIEISAALRLFDGFQDSLRSPWSARAAIRGVLRLGTGRPSSGRVPFEIGTGTGQTSADAAAILDLRMPWRLVTTLAGQYTAYFGSAKVLRVPGDEYSPFPLGPPLEGSWRAGNTIQVDVTPRIVFTDYFTAHGAYTFRRQEGSSYTSPDLTAPPLFDATTEQRVGFGFGYSSLARYARGRTRVPFEAFLSQLQTIAGSGGLTPRYTRTQLELRVYYRLRRGR